MPFPTRVMTVVFQTADGIPLAEITVPEGEVESSAITQGYRVVVKAEGKFPEFFDFNSDC